jgi:ABC-type polysaccharide/polyol phosphate export permease
MAAHAIALWQRRDLVLYLVACRIRSSVRHTIAGSAWFLLLPLAQTGIYYLLVIVIFKSAGRFGADPFVTIMIGYMHYLILLQTISIVLPSIFGGESILLQSKLEPLVLVSASFIQMLRTSWFGVAIALACWALIDPHITRTLAFYPVVLGLWILFCAIFGLVSAVLAVFVRDLQRLAPIVAQIVMYGSPVLYTLDFIPSGARDFFLLNPIACIFALFQWSLLAEPLPPYWAIAFTLAFLTVSAVLAMKTYIRLQPRFTKAF